MWPYHQKDVNQITLNHITLKLNFTSISSLRSNFVDCESFLESNSLMTFLLYICETNLDDSIEFGNFSVRGYLPLIWKDSCYRYAWSAVYVKKGLPFARDLSLENSADSNLRFWLAFSPINHLLCLYVLFLILFHLT